MSERLYAGDSCHPSRILAPLQPLKGDHFVFGRQRHGTVQGTDGCRCASYAKTATAGSSANCDEFDTRWRRVLRRELHRTNVMPCLHQMRIGTSLAEARCRSMCAITALLRGRGCRLAYDFQATERVFATTMSHGPNTTMHMRGAHDSLRPCLLVQVPPLR